MLYPRDQRTQDLREARRRMLDTRAFSRGAVRQQGLQDRQQIAGSPGTGGPMGTGVIAAPPGNPMKSFGYGAALGGGGPQSQFLAGPYLPSPGIQGPAQPVTLGGMPVPGGPGGPAVTASYGSSVSGVGSIKDALMGLPGRVKGWVEGVTADMGPLEKAQLLTLILSGAADVYGSYKAGQEKDRLRRQRERSAETLRPFVRAFLEAG